MRPPSAGTYRSRLQRRAFPGSADNIQPRALRPDVWERSTPRSRGKFQTRHLGCALAPLRSASDSSPRVPGCEQRIPVDRRVARSRSVRWIGQSIGPHAGAPYRRSPRAWRLVTFCICLRQLDSQPASLLDTEGHPWTPAIVRFGFCIKHGACQVSRGLFWRVWAREGDLVAARATASAVHRHIGQGASQKMRRKELAPRPPSQVGSRRARPPLGQPPQHGSDFGICRGRR